jgi:hypothetical protein
VRACASAPQNMRFQLELAPRLENKCLTWPSETSDEVPRYFYAGELTGEPDFAKREADANSLALTTILAASVCSAFDQVNGKFSISLLSQRSLESTRCCHRASWIRSIYTRRKGAESAGCLHRRSSTSGVIPASFNCIPKSTLEKNTLYLADSIYRRILSFHVSPAFPGVPARARSE